MRIAIVSDIHGNRQAFEAVLDEIEASDCEELWCLGDLVGYGADPDACVELARRHAAVCLAGNHDLGVRGSLPLEQFSRGAALAAKWTQETIVAETREYLDGLEPLNLDEQVGLYHASPELERRLSQDRVRHRRSGLRDPCGAAAGLARGAARVRPVGTG